MAGPLTQVNNIVRPVAGFAAGCVLTLAMGALSTKIHRKYLHREIQASESQGMKKPPVNPKIGLANSIAICILGSRLKLLPCKLGSQCVGNLCAFALGSSTLILPIETALLLTFTCALVAYVVDSIVLKSIGPSSLRAEVFANLTGAMTGYALSYLIAKMTKNTQKLS